jgi:4-amino-4-deoxy-L-arabinose transferase-like glycosyltransferase
VRRSLALLLIVASVTFLVGLGRAAISDSDEAFYAEAAREMVESGDWLTPYYNYEVRFQKPVLYYWLAAAAFEVGRPGEIPARLPAAAAGILLVVVTWGIARRLNNPRVALLAGLITASNFGYFALGRLALPDLPLAALMTLTTWAALAAADAYGRPARAAVSPAAGLGFVIAAAVAAALGFLMKGPVAVALPVLTVTLVTWLGLGGRRRLLPVPVGWIAVAAVVFTIIAAPWFLAMAREHGVSYLYRFFVAENVERFATDRYNEPRSPLFYVPIVLGGLAPWTAFLVLAVPPLLARLRGRRESFPEQIRVLIIWAAVPFLFYSVSVGKQPRYILPVLPPLAVLVAAAIARRLEGAAVSEADRRWLAWLGTVTACGFVGLGLLLLRAVPLLGALSPEGTRAAGILVVGAGVIIAWVAWRSPPRLAAVLTAAAICALLSVHYSVYSARGSDPVERMAAAWLHARQDDEPSATHHVFVRNLVFYTGIRQENLSEFDDLQAFLRQPRRVLCVVRQRDLERLRQMPGLPVRVLSSLTYLNPAGVRLKTLLWPQPARDLEEVHLITNR